MLTYTVQHGDTLWEIAKENQINLDSLLMANPQISDPNIIMPGMKLNIPQLSPYSRNSNTANNPNTANKAKAATVGSETKKPQNTGGQTVKQRPYFYFAKQGETLPNIAKANQIPLQELTKVNQHLPVNKALKNNDKVFIPNVSPATTKTATTQAAQRPMKNTLSKNTQNILICPRCGYKIPMN